MKQAQ